MGLSDHERHERIVWSAKELMSLNEDSKMPEKLKAHLSLLWPLVWGRKGNSTFWLFGGSATSPIREDAGDPWAIAIRSHFQDARPSAFDWLEENEEYQKENQVDAALSIEGILSSNPEANLVYRVYEFAESLEYGLRRYQDDFLKERAELDTWLSNLKGICFSFFSADDIYAKAYLGHRMLEDLYSRRGESVREALNAAHTHYRVQAHITAPELKDLIKIDKWRITHSPTARNKILLLVKLIRWRELDNYYLEELTKALKPEWGISLDALKKEVAAAVKKNRVPEKKKHPEVDKWEKFAPDMAIHDYDTLEKIHKGRAK